MCQGDKKKVKNESINKIYEKMRTEKDTKGLYGLTAKLTSGKPTTSPQQYIDDGKIISKPAEMANLQLDHYVEKVDSILNNLPTANRNPLRYLDSALDKWAHKDARPFFKFKEITLSETSVLISTLSQSSSSGHGGLTSLAIKSAMGKLLIPVQHIVNTSFKSESFAMKWKLSAINPRLKSQGLDRSSTTSYRPISLLPTTSKIVERAAQQQLLVFMEESGQLNGSCHAYRKNLSTMTTLTDILDDIYQGADENKFMSMLSIDQSSAFDIVDKDILLLKLERYNIGISARRWIADYLSNRSQYVVIGTSRSRMLPVTRGVPQGSVIGPLLYALLVNDITETVKDRGCQRPAHADNNTLFGTQCDRCGTLSGYADDTTYVTASKTRVSNQTRVLTVMDELTLYLAENKLAVNKSKTQLTELMIAQKRAKVNRQHPIITIEKQPGIFVDIW